MALRISRFWHTVRSWFGTKRAPRHRRRWYQQAKSLDRSEFLDSLASDVVADLLDKRPFGVTIEALIQGVRESRGSDLQHEAERFIEAHYFGYPSTSPEFYEMLESFRRLVQSRLLNK